MNLTKLIFNVIFAWILLFIGEIILFILIKLYHPDRMGSISMLTFYGWFLWAPIPYFTVKQFPFRKSRVWSFIVAHLVTLFLYFTMKAYHDLIIHELFQFYYSPDSPLFYRLWHFTLQPPIPFNLLLYIGIVGIFYSIDYYNKYRERELQTAQLESQLANTQLQLIHMQLNPHFLFNTLNGISVLIHKDPETADKMIVSLSDLLRSTLANTGQQYVSLTDELETLNRYLDIEKMRFGNRLKVEQNMDAKSKAAKIPNMLLQPLLENAVKHGISKISQEGVIRIECYVENDDVNITIDDNGPGFEQSAIQKGQGLGIKKCHERLQLLYPNQHQLLLTDSPLKGARVFLQIPFQE